MFKKVAAVVTALFTAALISVCSLAYPAFSESVVGSKSIDILTCKNWLIAQSDPGELTNDLLEAGYTWSLFESKKYVTAASKTNEDMGYQWWYAADGTLTCDMFSNGQVTRIAGDPDPAPSDDPVPSDMSGIIGDVSTGVGGVFSMSKSGFDFITGNDICMFMVAISFAGVGLGLIGRAFKTSRK